MGARLRRRPVGAPAGKDAALPNGTPLQTKTDPNRPGWVHAVVSDGPDAGQQGWLQRRATKVP